MRHRKQVGEVFLSADREGRWQWVEDQEGNVLEDLGFPLSNYHPDVARAYALGLEENAAHEEEDRERMASEQTRREWHEELIAQYEGGRGI